MKELTREQRTYEWYKARFGMFTASAVHVLMGKTDLKKGEFGKTAMDYLDTLAGERLMVIRGKWDAMSDEEKDNYLNTQYPSSAEMRWGTEHEGSARCLFSFLNGVEVKEVGSCVSDEYAFISASPDGVIEGKDEIIEIKCPKLNTFTRYTNRIDDAETLKEEKPEYYWQIVLQLYVTGAKKCHFCWYHPQLGIVSVEIERNEEDEKALVDRIIKAEEIVKAEFEKLKSRLKLL